MTEEEPSLVRTENGFTAVLRGLNLYPPLILLNTRAKRRAFFRSRLVRSSMCRPLAWDTAWRTFSPSPADFVAFVRRSAPAAHGDRNGAGPA